MTPRESEPNVLLGVLLVACGQARGLRHFRGTTQGFLASLAPLVAFPLVGATLLLLGGGGLAAITDLLATLSALLAPAVLSHALAQLWGREAEWCLYATAFNWCQWAIPMAAALVLLVLGGLLMLGLPNVYAAYALAAGLGGYGLWLHWFLARRGLALGGARAALLVLVVNFGTTLLVVAARLLGGHAGFGLER